MSKAIYSITSWFPNRRFLSIVDKLNRDFINNESNMLGTIKISDLWTFEYEKVKVDKYMYLFGIMYIMCRNLKGIVYVVERIYFTECKKL